MKVRYKPETVDQKLAYLVEECGEVLHATGKSQRWGLDSFNPELPPMKQVTNRFWLLQELEDLRQAIELVEQVIDD